jgi:hypothetical protein
MAAFGCHYLLVISSDSFSFLQVVLFYVHRRIYTSPTEHDRASAKNVSPIIFFLPPVTFMVVSLIFLVCYLFVGITGNSLVSKHSREWCLGPSP